jgi:hypothetical protein
LPTLKPTQEFKFLPHRTFSSKAFWLSHIAAHLQAPTSQHSNQRLAKAAISHRFKVNLTPKNIFLKNSCIYQLIVFIFVPS